MHANTFVPTARSCTATIAGSAQARHRRPGAALQRVGRALGIVTMFVMALIAAPMAVQARSAATPFLTAAELDLAHFLPSPPTPTSAKTKAEIAELLVLQSRRRPERVERAKADAEEGIVRFWPTVSTTVAPDLSATAQQFFDAVLATEGAIVDPVKILYARPRPHMTNPRVKPVVRRSTTGAWPSGHAASGWLMAIVLADMLPEHRQALFERADDYAESRLVAGIHHRSDVIVGRQAGALIALALQRNPEFLKQQAMVRTELRTKLNLPN